jgi:hypothetical protein
MFGADRHKILFCNRKDGKSRLPATQLLSEWSRDIMESGERKQSAEFFSATLRTDAIEIVLPEGYMVDELPRPISINTDQSVKTVSLRD